MAERLICHEALFEGRYENKTKDSHSFTLLLSSTVDRVFEEKDLFLWLDEALEVLRNSYPDCIIYIKPHPMQETAHLERVYSKLNSEREIITNVHTSCLALYSKAVISSSSSAILDVLSMDVPVILHQRFTSCWMKRHPEKSSYLELGIPHSEDKDTLRKLLISVLGSSHCQPNIRKKLKQREDLSIFQLDSAELKEYFK
jgi:hypothetical protein